MEATLEYTVSVPVKEAALLRTVSRKMGWRAKRQRNYGSPALREAIKDVEEGRVTEVHSFEEFLRHMNDDV